MELLIIWLLTIIVSIGIDISLMFKMIKDVADQGYKFKMDKFSELASHANPEVAKRNKMALYIPFFNLFLELDKRMKYEQNRALFGEQLRIMNCIIPFTKEEEKNYNKKPTCFNAWLTIIKSEIADETKRNISISFNEEDGKSTIWFENVDGDFKVIKTSGPVSRLPLEEQKKKLIENLTIVAEKLRSKMTKEELEQAIAKGGTIELDKMPVKEELKDETQNDSNSLAEQESSSKAATKHQLEQLKDYIVYSTDHSIDEEKGHEKVLKPNNKK